MTETIEVHTDTHRMSMTCLSLRQFGGEVRLLISDGALLDGMIMPSFSFFLLKI